MMFRERVWVRFWPAALAISLVLLSACAVKLTPYYDRTVVDDLDASHRADDDVFCVRVRRHSGGDL